MATKNYLVLAALTVTILSIETSSFSQSLWQSNPHNSHGNFNSRQNNLHTRQNTSQILLNRNINRQINPKNWRNSSENWKYKTTKFTNQVGIFDSDGKRFEYRDPREDKITVKSYSNSRSKLSNQNIFGFIGN